MLREIRIRNVVLLEDVRLELEPAFNVLTGETGAGKTIVLEALGLLFGERFNAGSVRQGAERAQVEGVFDAPSSAAFQSWWEEHGLGEISEILIRREGTADGRSRAFLNDRPVTLRTLEELREFIVDIHGQNEHQQILRSDCQRLYLDRFADLSTTAAAVSTLFSQWKRLTEDLQKQTLSEQERLQRLDLYRFQLEEISKAKPLAGEDEEIALRLPELKHAEKLRTAAREILERLYDNEGAVVEQLGHIGRLGQSLASLAPHAVPLVESMAEIQERLEDCARQWRSMSERWQVDPEALEEALSRQDLLDRLKKKYGGTLEKVLAYADQLRRDVDQVENADVYRRALEAERSQAEKRLAESSRELSQKRQTAAKRLSQAVEKELKELGLGQARFFCRVEENRNSEGLVFSSTGINEVVFEWTPNPGEGVRPLKEIISGGEMSRVMLALKTVLAQADALELLVFDEIDAGIGGVTAQAVGRKLRALSRHHQILCVSHLPQIAACAQAHFHVSKRINKTRTFATVVRLQSSERLHEIARLLGSQITPISVQHAEELIAQAR